MKFLKKTKIYALPAVLCLIGMQSCSPVEDDVPGIGPKPSEPEITFTEEGNKLNFSAASENAFTYYWDFGNGSTATGKEATAAYKFPGDYEVAVTAYGKGGHTNAVKTVTVNEGDPEVFSEYNLLLTGYDPGTSESKKIWIYDRSAGAVASGAPVYGESNYFDPIDVSWWESGEDEMEGLGCYDDEYSFKLNKTFDYINNPGEGFLYNWAWANKLRGTHQEEYSDISLPYEPPTSSWEISTVKNEDDTAYVLHLTNNAWLGIANGTHTYQILRLTEDTLWVRYDATSPEGSPGADKDEWDYIRFIAK